MNAGTRKGAEGEKEKERAALISAIRPRCTLRRIALSIDGWMGANGATGSDAPLCGPLLFFSSTFPSLLCIIDDSSASSLFPVLHRCFVFLRERERERFN